MNRPKISTGISFGILKVFQQINKSGTAILMATHSYGLIKKISSPGSQMPRKKTVDSKKESFRVECQF